ncbi:MucBP domain-containing protein, partial [Lacticaseibacillus paracasei]
DIEGNMLAPDKVITGKVGDPYTMTAPAFDYYENPQLATDSAPANGTFTNDVQTVTFVYTKTPIPRGSVNVKFVDVDGKRLASDKILTGQAGDPYEARP